MAKFAAIKFFERRVIGAESDPLLVRYILFRSAAFGIYLHKLCRSDYDRALHDHPWPFISIVLKGAYIEMHDQTPDRSDFMLFRERFDVAFRPAEWRHRVVMLNDSPPVWTLVLVGARKRRWGFWLPSGFCWWRKFNYEKAICEDEPIWEGGSD